MDISGFNIAAVERDTGLSKDVLRVWERRYGFPMPERDANGDRIYPQQQVAHLRQIKRLMDQGHRPGRLLATPQAELALLTPLREHDSRTQNSTQAELDALMSMIQQHDGVAFLRALQLRLARDGVHSLVVDIVAPLATDVGQAWADARITVFEEHLFSELILRTLRQAIASLPATTRSPRVVLATVPNEQHGLGLLMAEALLVLNGAECIPLGTQLPMSDIHAASKAHRADIVALSFSSSYPQRRISGLVRQLRQLVAPRVSLWVGGNGAQNLPAIHGVDIVPSLEAITIKLDAWRGGRHVRKN